MYIKVIICIMLHLLKKMTHYSALLLNLVFI